MKVGESTHGDLRMYPNLALSKVQPQRRACWSRRSKLYEREYMVRPAEVAKCEGER